MFDNIRGVITFEAVSAEPENFLNILKQSTVSVSDIRYRNGKIYGKVYNSDFPTVCEIAKENAVPISISEKRGSIFRIKKYRLRFGIAIGVFLSLLMIFYLSNIVMSIEIYGNETLTDKQIGSILSDAGIKIGAFIPNIDLRDAERRIVASTDEIKWIGIRSSGCKIQAEISEMTDPPEMISTHTPCNIVSAKDAQIVDIKKIYNGMLIPMLYDGVKKGDLLVSGTVEDGHGGVYLVHSMGEVIGRYTEKVTFSQPYNDEIFDYSERVKRKYFTFLGLKIPLYIGRNDFGQYEYDETATHFRICNIELPIGTLISEYRPYSIEKISYTPEKAKQILEGKIKLYEKNFLSDGDVKVVDKEVFFSETDSSSDVTVKYTLEGNIGIQQEIMAK